MARKDIPSFVCVEQNFGPSQVIVINCGQFCRLPKFVAEKASQKRRANQIKRPERNDRPPSNSGKAKRITKKAANAQFLTATCCQVKGLAHSVVRHK